MGTTKKRRKRVFGAAKAKKDAKAYIAPTCGESIKRGKGKGRGKTTTHHLRHGSDNCVAYSMLAM